MGPIFRSANYAVGIGTFAIAIYLTQSPLMQRVATADIVQLDEEGNPMQLDATASGTDTNGLIRLEGIMAADLTMTADADAKFTVSS